MTNKFIVGYENIIIGYAIKSLENFAYVKAELNESDFIITDNQAIYNACGKILTCSDPDQRIFSFLRIEIELNKCSKSQSVAHLKHVFEQDINASKEEISCLIKEIKDYAIRKNVSEIGSTISKSAFSQNHNVEDVVNEAIHAFLKTQGNDSPQTKKEVIKNVFQQIRSAITNKGKITGIDTGFSGLNNITGGLQNTDLIILAARPSIGKTAFALNLLKNGVLKGKKKGLFLSYEMGLEQLTLRTMSMLSKVDAQAIKFGNITPEDIQKLVEASKIIEQEDFFFSDESNSSVGNIRAKITSEIILNGIEFVVIDYLQLLKSGKNHINTVDEISEITRELKLTAKSLKIPIILLSQLNRKVEERIDKRPIMSDLRQSGSIEQDADIVIFLYRDDYYNPNTTQPNVTEVIIAKHRNGPLGTIPLHHNLAQTSYKDIVYS